MCVLKPNGFLVQGLEDINYKVKNFKYLGINAYHQYPLSTVNDSYCKMITEQQRVKNIESEYQFLEFISDMELLKKYLGCCFKLGIKTRTLFIESRYPFEEWKEPFLNTVLLGYEYCPIPIDEQIITDLDWYPPFSKFWSKMNKNGLFDTYDDALAFKRTYDLSYNNKQIGDGEINAFICRVSELNIKDIDTLL